MNPSPQFNAVRAQNIGVLGKIANIFCGQKYGNRVNFYRTYILPIIERIYYMLVNEEDPEVR